MLKNSEASNEDESSYRKNNEEIVQVRKLLLEKQASRSLNQACDWVQRV
jgi:hypothetical protein